MIPAQGKESAANVFHITCDQGSFRPAAFPRLRRQPSTGPLNIFQDLSSQERFEINVKEDHIQRLFMSVLDHSGQDTDAVREVFSVLVKTTLKYRDHILTSKGIVVTVEDVRTVLSWLVPALATGCLPETDNKIRQDLLTLWLDELKVFGNPNPANPETK